MAKQTKPPKSKDISAILSKSSDDKIMRGGKPGRGR